MPTIGYKVGVFSPCFYFHPVTRVIVFCHGDDFVVPGTRSDQKACMESLSKHCLVKHIATMGPNPEMGDSREVRILNRIIRWVRPPFGAGTERIEYEAR